MNLFFKQNDSECVETEIPKIVGRILVDGEIIGEGFARKKVYSQSQYQGSFPEIGETPNVDESYFLKAVEAAHRAWAKGLGKWPMAKAEERIEAVTRFRDFMQEHRIAICRLLMWEIGKNWVDSLNEFDRTIVYINDTLEEVKRMERDNSRFQFAGGLLAQIRRSPLGVTLCMGPFNYPLNETFTTLIPALIMGNVVVVKVPRFGELFWDLLLEGFKAFFPKGVVNILNGQGRTIVGPAVKTGLIDVLAFIGSSPVAGQIKHSHPKPNRFRAILGLDAKNPAIIFPDANLDLAVAECVRGALSFNGQRCTALKILFVHHSISEVFTSKFSQAVDKLKCGFPWQEGVQITPLPDRKKPKYLRELIGEALAKGAKIANSRGMAWLNSDDGESTLCMPVVLSHVDVSSRVAHEEQFGPLVPIVTYDSFDQVESFIIDSKFGSQISLFGQDPTEIGRWVDLLSNQVCRININTQCQRGPDVFPFTGRKDSAEGTLSVYDALRSFSIRTMVAAKQDLESKQLIRAILDGDHSNFLSTNIVL